MKQARWLLSDMKVRVYQIQHINLQSSKQAMAPIENFPRDRRLFAGYSSEQDERSNSNAIIDVIRWRVWYLARGWLVTGSAALKRSQGRLPHLRVAQSRPRQSRATGVTGEMARQSKGMAL